MKKNLEVIFKQYFPSLPYLEPIKLRFDRHSNMGEVLIPRLAIIALDTLNDIDKSSFKIDTIETMIFIDKVWYDAITNKIILSFHINTD